GILRRQGEKGNPRPAPLSQIGRNGSLTKLSGSSSAVERQLPKLDVTGSIPVSRSTFSITWRNGFRSCVRNCVHVWSFHSIRPVTGSGLLVITCPAFVVGAPLAARFARGDPSLAAAFLLPLEVKKKTA